MDFIMANEDIFQSSMEQFGKLYEMCFPQKMSTEEIKWRYLDNPSKDILACFAIEKGEIVANYSVSPIRLLNDGKLIKAGLSLNTMTHPDFTGKGLFVKLASKVYAEMQEREYKLVFGFPNYISNRTFIQKLGWNDIHEIPMMELDITNWPLIDQNEKNIVEDEEYSLNYDKCIAKRNKIMVYKPKEYMIWKYRKNPTNKYYNFVILDQESHVSSRIVCKEYQNRVNIVDMYMRNENEAEALFRYAINWGKKRQKNLITLWCTLGSDEHIVLEKLGFRNSIPITYFGANVFSEGTLDYYKYRNWEINLSDDNVF